MRLSVQGIVKRFGATTALGGVDLDLAEGSSLPSSALPARARPRC
ncbi:hypothetical protein ACFQY5_31630 [Paeniroseomonas aquatica]